MEPSLVGVKECGVIDTQNGQDNVLDPYNTFSEDILSLQRAFENAKVWLDWGVYYQLLTIYCRPSFASLNTKTNV
jgi:hypothetical protein